VITGKTKLAGLGRRQEQARCAGEGPSFSNARCRQACCHALGGVACCTERNASLVLTDPRSPRHGGTACTQKIHPACSAPRPWETPARCGHAQLPSQRLTEPSASRDRGSFLQKLKNLLCSSACS